ncbi:MAG: 23S rRNA (guanosine(2251)-2'-O)-methyltransferase RlmB [Candidatus Aminicenantes bacterium]|nr:23S rRNA (guanosine(2251)-2'-O)-methyltransferase RlmB [Candidatus Aminicenantes bacterium]
MPGVSSLNALIEALKDGLPINKVLISRSRHDAKIATVVRMCRELRIVFQFVPAEAVERKAGVKNQGVYAEIAPVSFFSLDTVLADAKTGLVVILDNIEDTGNLGAMIRSAAAVASDAVLVSIRNSAPVNETVWRTSAGAMGKVRLVQSRNLAMDIEKLKKAGFWVVATDPHAKMNFYDFDFKSKTAVIFGNESKGVSPLLKKNADQLLAIPHAQGVESLNVSAAAAIILYEAWRQKKG